LGLPIIERSKAPRGKESLRQIYPVVFWCGIEHGVSVGPSLKECNFLELGRVFGPSCPHLVEVDLISPSSRWAHLAICPDLHGYFGWIECLYLESLYEKVVSCRLVACSKD